MGRLSGKVAIITGAASGMGAAEARLFAKEGAKVIATDMQEELLQTVVNEINSEHGEAVLALKHNVTEENEWKDVITRAVNEFGKIDILINNAGITGKLAAIEDYTIEEWNKVMNINATGNFLGIKHAAPEMKNNGQGSIVNISSLAAMNGSAGVSAYTASKGAVRSLTKGAAVALGTDQIRVNSIHPGYIETPMLSGVTSNENLKNQLLSTVPLGYLGRPEDVAHCALFLASDESRFVSGIELIVDGGQSVRG